MIHKDFKFLEKYLKDNGLSKEYLSLRLLKSAEPLSEKFWEDELSPIDRGGIPLIEKATKEKLVDSYKSKFRKYTEEELMYIIPQLNKKSVVFKWICELKSMEFDDIPIDQVWSDNALEDVFYPKGDAGAIVGEIIRESIELESLLEAIKENDTQIKQIESEGINDKDGNDVLKTKEGREGADYVTNWMIEKGAVEMMPKMITSSEISADLESRLLLDYAKNSGESTDSTGQILNNFGESYHSSIGAYNSSQEDQMTMFEAGDHIWEPHGQNYYWYFDQDMGYSPIDYDDDMADPVYEAYEKWSLEEYWSRGQKAPGRLNFEPWWLGSTQTTVDEDGNEVPPQHIDQILDEDNIDGGISRDLYWEDVGGIGPFDARWRYMLAYEETFGNKKSPSIQDGVPIYFGTESLYENFAWPTPIYEATPGWYMVNGKKVYYEPKRHDEQAKANRVIGTQWRAVDDDRLIDYETGEGDWEAALDETQLWYPSTNGLNQYGFFRESEYTQVIKRSEPSRKYSKTSLLRDGINYKGNEDSFSSFYGSSRLNNYYDDDWTTLNPDTPITPIYNFNIQDIYDSLPLQAPTEDVQRLDPIFDISKDPGSFFYHEQDATLDDARSVPACQTCHEPTNKVDDNKYANKKLTLKKLSQDGRGMPIEEDPRVWQSRIMNCEFNYCHNGGMGGSGGGVDWNRETSIAPEAVSTMDPGYVAFKGMIEVDDRMVLSHGYSPHDIIERQRYKHTSLYGYTSLGAGYDYDSSKDRDRFIYRDPSTSEIKEINDEIRSSLGKEYDPSVPPGMNELLRATYQQNLVPFYMDIHSVPPEHRSKLGFDTYNMSVPKSLRTLWYVGNSRDDNFSEWQVEGKLKDVRTGQKDDNFIVIGVTNPGTFHVDYFMMDSSGYTNILVNYSELTKKLRPTISKWMTYASRSRIESSDPKLLSYYKRLEENDNDPRVMLSPDLHPYDRIKKEDISENEIGKNGTKSEWLIDQFWASQTNTSIEFIEQMSTVGFFQDTGHHKRSRDPFWFHFAWDLGGALPVVGMLFDITHFAWYYHEGKYLYAALSLLCLAPFAGDILNLIVAMGKGAILKLAVWVTNNFAKSKAFIMSALKGTKYDGSKLVAALNAFKETKVLSSKLIDEVAGEITIQASKQISNKVAVQLLGGGAKGQRRLDAMMAAEKGGSIPRRLTGNHKKLFNRNKHGVGKGMEVLYHSTKWVPDWWGIRTLKTGAKSSTGVIDNVVSNAAVANGLSGWSKWLLKKSASNSSHLDEWLNGIRTAYVRSPGHNPFHIPGVAPTVARVSGGTARNVLPSGASQSVKRVLKQDETGKVVEEITAPGLHHSFFDDIGEIRVAQSKWSQWRDAGVVPFLPARNVPKGMKHHYDYIRGGLSGGNAGKWKLWESVLPPVGKARLALYGMITGCMYMSIGFAMHSVLRINALLALAEEMGVDESAKKLGLTIRECLYNPAALEDKYNEVTGACPSIAFTEFEPIDSAYINITEDFLYNKVDSWLEGGWFKNLFEDVTLEHQLPEGEGWGYGDIEGKKEFPKLEKATPVEELPAYEDFNKLYESKEWAGDDGLITLDEWEYECPDGPENKSKESEGYKSLCDPSSKHFIGPEWYRTCPTGETEGLPNVDYKKECDPKDPEFVGPKSSVPSWGYIGDRNIPDEWYESLDDPDSYNYGSGIEALKFQKEESPDISEGPMRDHLSTSKSKTLKELLDENENLKEELEALHDEIMTEFEGTVLNSLEGIFEGASEINRYCSPELVLHLIMVTKFCRYLVHEDVVVRMGKWNAYADITSLFMMIKSWDHVSWGAELLHAGDVVLTEIPQIATIDHAYRNIEQRACDDSELVLAWLRDFWQQLSDLQGSEGWNNFERTGHGSPATSVGLGDWGMQPSPARGEITIDESMNIMDDMVFDLDEQLPDELRFIPR